MGVEAIEIDKAEIVRAIRAERLRSLGLLRGLDPPQWEIEVVPGWRVREVVAHLITLDRGAVTGALLPTLFKSTDALERWNDVQVVGWADRPISDLLLAVEAWGRRFLAVAKAIPSRALHVTLPTLWGRGPAGMFLWSRPFDEWVHRQDIRRALGSPDEDTDLAPIAGFVLAATATSVLPQLAARGIHEGRVCVDLSGVPLPPWWADVAPAWARCETQGPAAGPGVAVIRAHAPAFIMTAAGRGTFEDLERRGELTIEGEETLARAFLSTLRVV